MSPALSPQARAAGQRVTDAYRAEKAGTWRCLEPGCGAEGVEQSRKARERALYHHIADHHNDPRF